MVATSSGDSVSLVFIDKTHSMRLERRASGGQWQVWCEDGAGGAHWETETPASTPTYVKRDFVDVETPSGLWQYRAADSTATGEPDWDLSMWVRAGGGKIGWSFGNYEVPEGEWGEVATADDVRYTWLWGVDFKASNGDSFSDEQILYYVDAALAEIERSLCVVLKKTRYASDCERRNLVKGEDYDKEEGRHVFRPMRSGRTYRLAADARPIIKVTKCDLVSRVSGFQKDLLADCDAERQSGVIDIYRMPPLPRDSARGLDSAVGFYGNASVGRNLIFRLDYVAGYETAADVPADLRNLVGKMAAVSMLNVVGRGLMSGFSSSSLSMDGMSESFSSTQSATSAYYGADIKEYKDDIDRFFKENRRKLGFMAMGCV